VGIEAIADLMPIHLHLKKLQEIFHFRGSLLLSNHIIKSIISTSGSNKHIILHHLSLNKLTHKQQLQLHSLLIDIDNKCNKFLLSFSLFDKECSPGKRLIDSFLDNISFHMQKQDIKSYLCDLDNVAISTSIDPHSIMVISDTSIRNNVATSISHIYLYNRLIIKTIHHMVNITSTEAKLFTIRCRVNQAISIPNIKHIVVVTDSLHAAKKIFDSLMHPYQIHSTAISQELRNFFKKDSNNHIDFWDCPNKQKWILYFLVDKNTRKFDFSPILPYKSSWDFYKKYEYDSISAMWRMNFQALNLKGRNFLELFDDDSNPLEPSTIKSRPWL